MQDSFVLVRLIILLILIIWLFIVFIPDSRLAHFIKVDWARNKCLYTIFSFLTQLTGLLSYE